MAFSRLGSIGRESVWGGGRAAPVALPSLPLATGAKVMGLGHSMIQRGNQTQGGGTGPITLMRETNRGVLNWVKWLDQRFNLDCWGDQFAPSWDTTANLDMWNGANQGLNGDALGYQSSTTPGTLYRTPYMLARKPNIIFLDIGQNDIFYLNLDAPTVEGLYDQQLRALNRAGIWVVASTVYPSLTYGPGTTQDNVRLAFNTWLLAQASLRTGLVVVNADTVLGTSVNTNYQDVASGGHLTDTGAYLVASGLVLPALQGLVSNGNYYDTNPGHSNLLSSAVAGALGAGGTKIGNITGSVATGWRAATSTASTIVASKENVSANSFTFTASQTTTVMTVTGTPGQLLAFGQMITGGPTVQFITSFGTGSGGAGTYNMSVSQTIGAGSTLTSSTQQKQNLAITPVNSGASIHSFTFRPLNSVSLSSIGVNAGDWVQFMMLVEKSAWAYWQGDLQIFATDNAGTVNMQAWTVGAGTLPEPTTALTFWAISPPIQVPTGTTEISFGTTSLFQIQWLAAASGTATIKFSQPILRKVTDPRTAWHLP